MKVEDYGLGFRSVCGKYASSIEELLKYDLELDEYGCTEVVVTWHGRGDPPVGGGDIWNLTIGTKEWAVSTDKMGLFKNNMAMKNMREKYGSLLQSNNNYCVRGRFK